MGPFTLLDFVGLDTTYYIANIMFDEFHEKRFASAFDRATGYKLLTLGSLAVSSSRPISRCQPT